MNADAHPKRKDDILKRDADETVVLLNLKDGQYYALNEVGGRVWELCDGSRTVNDVVTTLCSEYDAPRETLEADVMEILEELSGADLLVDAAL